jgi:nitroreductase
MHFRDIVTQCRSYRRFDSGVPVTEDAVRDLVELVCYVPSAKNLQPLKYISVSEPDTVAALFPFLSWVGYLADWPGPMEGERPTAYVVMLGDQSISTDFACDSGIAAQTLLLGATASGIGGCIVASLEHKNIRELLKIPEKYAILMTIALGTPLETVVIDQISGDDSVRYFRDVHSIHHVPKRMLDDVLLRFH